MDINAAMTTATGQMIDAIGLVITYTPQNPAGPAVQITALFDNESMNIVLGMGLIGSSSPKALCKTVDVPNSKKGDLVTAEGVNYKVTEPNPDGTGGTELVLTKA